MVLGMVNDDLRAVWRIVMGYQHTGLSIGFVYYVYDTSILLG